MTKIHIVAISALIGLFAAAGFWLGSLSSGAAVAPVAFASSASMTAASDAPSAVLVRLASEGESRSDEMRRLQAEMNDILDKGFRYDLGVATSRANDAMSEYDAIKRERCASMEMDRSRIVDRTLSESMAAVCAD